jgi:hypothetical protein
MKKGEVKNKMNKQIITTFTILIFALAITGYAYSHWQETLQIQGTAQIAKFGIIIESYRTDLTVLYTDSHTLTLNGTINPNQPVLTEINIENIGTTPATITTQINTNNTELWNTHFIYSQTPTSVGELLAGKTVSIQQNITLKEKPGQPFTIEVTVTYIATWQGWTNTITITYILTLPDDPADVPNGQADDQNASNQAVPEGQPTDVDADGQNASQADDNGGDNENGTEPANENNQNASDQTIPEDDQNASQTNDNDGNNENGMPNEPANETNQPAENNDGTCNDENITNNGEIIGEN